MGREKETHSQHQLTFTDAFRITVLSVLALRIRFAITLLGRFRTLVFCSWLALFRPRACILPIRRFAFAGIRAYSVDAFCVLSTRIAFALAFIDLFTVLSIA